MFYYSTHTGYVPSLICRPSHVANAPFSFNRDLRASRDVAVCASGSDPSPLDELPASLANRFRQVRSQRRDESAQRRESSSSMGPNQSGIEGSPTPSGRKPSPGRTLADVWHNSGKRGNSPAKTASENADKSVLAELAKAQAQRIVGSTAEQKPGEGGSDRPRSFLDTIRMAETESRNPVPKAVGSAASSRRSEDEQIRATRQQRMQEQGLDGNANTGWRRGTGGAEGQVSGAKDFSQLLRPDSETGTSLSAEQYTRQKEEEQRSRGAEIISSDASYKPAVGTWGVYNRPRDISAAYGGGRKLSPEDTTTSAEEQAEYDGRLKEKLSQFRRNAGLDVDPEVEAHCQALTKEGKVLLRKGQLGGALVIFDEAADLLSHNTTAGGEATLQKAITLDSLGRSDDARRLYRMLATHRNIAVAKEAKRMNFGFRAGEFLKADKFSYAATKEEYDPFFSSLQGKWNWDTAYVASEEDKAAENMANTILLLLASLLTTAPLGFLYYIYFQC